MLLGALGAGLLGSLLRGKGIVIADETTIIAGEGKIRSGQDF